VSEFQNSESRLIELKKLGELKEAGLLSEQEFEEEKNRLLNSTVEPSEGDLYKAGSYESRPATASTKFRRNPILSIIFFAWLGLVIVSNLFNSPLTGLLLLVVIEIILFFVSKKKGKKIGLTPRIIALIKSVRQKKLEDDK
jgi:hypothetical protein